VFQLQNCTLKEIPCNFPNRNKYYIFNSILLKVDKFHSSDFISDVLKPVLRSSPFGVREVMLKSKAAICLCLQKLLQLFSLLVTCYYVTANEDVDLYFIK